jgi:hypothetical protein
VDKSLIPQGFPQQESTKAYPFLRGSLGGRRYDTHSCIRKGVVHAESGTQTACQHREPAPGVPDSASVSADNEPVSALNPNRRKNTKAYLFLRRTQFCEWGRNHPYKRIAYPFLRTRMPYVRTLAYLLLRAEATIRSVPRACGTYTSDFPKASAHLARIVQGDLLRCVPVSATQLRIHARLKTDKAGGNNEAVPVSAYERWQTAYPFLREPFGMGPAPWWRVRCTRFCVDNPIASLIGGKSRPASVTWALSSIGAT